MPDKSLVMSFMNEEGKKVSLRLDGIKEDITGEAVGLVMDTIIAKNIFQSTGGDLKVKDSAQIVSRNVQALEVK
jgi:deoxyinosine 3'endonuclease (endonuclease V)